MATKTDMKLLSQAVATAIISQSVEIEIEHQQLSQRLFPGYTMLHFASLVPGHAAFMGHLIAARCNVDLQGANGLTPLHIAVTGERESVVKQLIEARCNVDAEGQNGATPLYISVHLGNPFVTEMLINARCNVDPQTQDNGTTPLHCAALRGAAAVTKLLITARCNLDQQTT
jgi:ankyrin